MESLIIVYICSLALNYLLVFAMERLRWSILEGIGQYQTKKYFINIMKKDFTSYLLWLQLMVIIPFYGVIVSLLFYINFNKELSKGRSNRFICLLKTHKGYQ